MRKKHATFSLPENTLADLHLYVSRRQISAFVDEQVKRGLEEKKELWAKAFEEAAKDEELSEEMKIWDVCVGDGLDESNEYK